MIEKQEHYDSFGERHDWDDIFDQMATSQLAQELLFRVKAQEERDGQKQLVERNHELAIDVARLESDLRDARQAIDAVKFTMRRKLDMALLAQCRHSCDCYRLTDSDEF